MLDKIVELIKIKQSFAMICHTSPDGDSLGSMIGLWHFLTDAGKTADIYVDDSVPDRYCFLPGISEIKTTAGLQRTYDVLFALDNGDPKRFGSCGKLMDCAEVVINLDHHLTNDQYGDINYVDTEASSVGEILYELMVQCGNPISVEAATGLYTSILSDTGGFKYANTTPKTMRTAAELIVLGVDFPSIANDVFEKKTLPQVMLVSEVASTVKTYFNGKAASVVLTTEMLKRAGAVEEDAADFVNLARNLSGVEVGIFVKEKSEGVSRVSLRSQTNADVRKIAERFGGGGHMRASGCTIEQPVEAALQMILELVGEVLCVTA